VAKTAWNYAPFNPGILTIDFNGEKFFEKWIEDLLSEDNMPRRICCIPSTSSSRRRY
jgi:hypothetical protein